MMFWIKLNTIISVVLNAVINFKSQYISRSQWLNFKIVFPLLACITSMWTEDKYFRKLLEDEDHLQV